MTQTTLQNFSSGSRAQIEEKRANAMKFKLGGSLWMLDKRSLNPDW